MAETASTSTPPSGEGGSSGTWLFPRWLTAPLESGFAALGSGARASAEWVGARGTRASSRARPWLEFIDFSAFGPAEGGLNGYLERIKLNAPYFMFNYLMLGLVLTCVSVITKPVALLGTVVVLWLYFQFFGVEATEEYYFMGFSLDDSEKLGVLVAIGLVTFWLTAGGFGIFLSVCSAVIFVTLLHGAFRKPSPAAIPPV